MWKMLLPILLISCTTEPDNIAPEVKETPSWPQNKKEVSGKSCTSDYYVDVSPEPERWEAYVTESLAGDTTRYSINLKWKDGKGFQMICAPNQFLQWEIYY
jgi:hypothetical protein